MFASYAKSVNFNSLTLFLSYCYDFTSIIEITISKQKYSFLFFWQYIFLLFINNYCFLVFFDVRKRLILFEYLRYYLHKPTFFFFLFLLTVIILSNLPYERLGDHVVKIYEIIIDSILHCLYYLRSSHIWRYMCQFLPWFNLHSHHYFHIHTCLCYSLKNLSQRWLLQT